VLTGSQWNVYDTLPVYLHFNGLFRCTCISWSSSIFFLHLFRQRTFGNNWHRFCGLDVIPVTQTGYSSIKALKGTQSTDPNRWAWSCTFFIYHWTSRWFSDTCTCTTVDVSLLYIISLWKIVMWICSIINLFHANCLALQWAEMRMVRWMCDDKVKDRVPSKELRDRIWLDDHLSTTAKQVATVWTCVAKRRQWLGEEIAFSALKLLVWQQEGHLAYKNWVVESWHGCMSGRGADLHMAQLMQLSLASVKSRLFLVLTQPGNPGQSPESHNVCVCWRVPDQEVD